MLRRNIPFSSPPSICGTSRSKAAHESPPRECTRALTDPGGGVRAVHRVGDADGGLDVHGGDADGGERDGQRQRGGGGGSGRPVGSGHGWKRTTERLDAADGTTGHGRRAGRRAVASTRVHGAGGAKRTLDRRNGRPRAHGIGGAGVSIFMHIRARAGGRARLSDDAYAAREITRPGRSDAALNGTRDRVRLPVRRRVVGTSRIG